MVPKNRTSFFFCRSKSKKKQKRKLQPRNITNRYGSIFAVFQHTNTHRGTKALFRCVVVEKSIRETDITCRDMLIVSTFPVPVIFSASPTYTHMLYLPLHTLYVLNLHCFSFLHTFTYTVFDFIWKLKTQKSRLIFSWKVSFFTIFLSC